MHCYLDEDDDDDDDDDENEETEEKKAKRAAKNAKYTTADMAKLRHILVNANRDKQLSAATKWVLGYYDSGGDTQAGNMVISTIPTKVKKAITAKTPLSQQFDALFAILYALNDWDPWMMDNEEYGAGGKLDSSINFLAKSWKVLWFLLYTSFKSVGYVFNPSKYCMLALTFRLC